MIVGTPHSQRIPVPDYLFPGFVVFGKRLGLLPVLPQALNLITIWMLPSLCKHPKHPLPAGIMSNLTSLRSLNSTTVIRDANLCIAVHVHLTACLMMTTATEFAILVLAVFETQIALLRLVLSFIAVCILRCVRLAALCATHFIVTTCVLFPSMMLEMYLALKILCLTISIPFP